MSIEFTFSSVYEFKSTTKIKINIYFIKYTAKLFPIVSVRHCLNSVQTICIGGAITIDLNWDYKDARSGVEGLPLVSDMHHVAFIYVELHLPFRFPTAKCVDIILQYCSVVFSFDFSVEDAVVCEETHLGFNSLGKIADIQNKQQGAQDSALGDSRLYPNWWWRNTIQYYRLTSRGQEIFWTSCAGRLWCLTGAV